jgi:hypothetical protein
MKADSVISTTSWDGCKWVDSETPGDVFDELSPVQLARGDVHGDLEGRRHQSFALEAPNEPTRLFEDPPADLWQEAAFVGDLQELAWPQESTVRVPPTQQGFDAYDGTAGKVVHRLRPSKREQSARRSLRASGQLE